MQVRKLAALVLIACLAAGCDRGPETIEQCADRFTQDEKMPISAGRVQASYTYDLSKMDRDELEHLTVTGLRAGGRPILMAANQDSNASRKEFYSAPLTQRGLLMMAGQSVLFRIPGGSHRSASDAVREGCSLIPGAKLQAVALTAG